MFSGISEEKGKTNSKGGILQGCYTLFFAEKWADEGMMRRGWSGGKPAVQHGLNYLSASEWVASDGEKEREKRD